MAVKITYKTESANNDRGIGSGRPEYSMIGIASKSYANITHFINLGITIKQEAEDVFVYKAASAFTINEKTEIVSEIKDDTIFSGKFNENSTSALIGFTYDFSKSITWDFGWTLGISKAAPNFKLTTGLTIPFGA